ncbi:unnamed protein product, partial [Vitis vinifera]
MDSFDFDSVKAEKANAMLKYRRLRNVTKLFRFAELFLVLILFFWIFTHLPFAIQISGEYFRKISTVIASHLFVFLFCNAIIEPEVVVYEDKQMICAANTLRPTCEKVVPTVTDSKRDSYVKVYRRSQSEKLNRDRSEKSRRILQRSDTEKCQQIVISGDDPAKTWYPEDELSNEDFQRTIEAFIARELRFRRQESLAIVLQDQN